MTSAAEESSTIYTNIDTDTNIYIKLKTTDSDILMRSSCFIVQDIPKRGKQKIQRDMRTGTMNIEVDECSLTKRTTINYNHNPKSRKTRFSQSETIPS